mgnify:FL=1
MKRKKSNKFAVSGTAAVPAAPVAEKAAPVEEAKVKTAPVSEAVPAVEAPAPEVKETKSTPKKKPAVKNEEVKKPDAFVIQSSGKEYTNDDIVELCKAAYRNGTRKQVKSCDVYLKAENGGLRAYYVINGNADGAFIDL